MFNGVVAPNWVSLRDLVARRVDLHYLLRYTLRQTALQSARKLQANTIMPGEAVDKRAAAREVIDILDEISTLLVR